MSNTSGGFMVVVTFKCSEKLVDKLKGESKGRKISKSNLIRQALEFYLERNGLTSSMSLYSLSKDLCGAVDGPEDLSDNSYYLEGYGQ